jgi:hypothetical protein
MGAGAVSVLRLPLSCVVLASLLVSKSGAGSEPLIIVGVVVAYLVTVGLSNVVDGPPAESAVAAAPAKT